MEASLFDPPPVPVADPKVSEVDKPRLSRQSAAVLSLLKSGPARTRTNAELAAITPRYGARLHDLRRSGYQIRTTELRDGSGRATYRLLSEP